VVFNRDSANKNPAVPMVEREKNVLRFISIELELKVTTLRLI